MIRRTFLKHLAFGAPAFAILPHTALSASSRDNLPLPDTHTRTTPKHALRADLVIIGASLGGCAAALAAARNGLRVILTEETDWIGGQLTSQAVPPDENAWVETIGATSSYQQLRQRIRLQYLRNYPLTKEAASKPFLNPGNGTVSRLCHEPRVALLALTELFAHFLSGARLTLLLRHKPEKADVHADRVQSVRVRNLETGHSLHLEAPWFIDATELGDLLPLTNTEYVTGAESRRDTAEPHAPDKPAPSNMQAFTCCFAMDYLPGQDHTIDRPAEYSFWRDFVPKLNPPWPGPLLAWEYTNPVTLKPNRLETDPERAKGFWVYRRIADKSLFAPGTYPSDITLVNWPQNDYLLGNICDVPHATAQKHIRRAQQLSLSLLYWLQTAAPRPDGGTGWPGLRLRPDIVGTENGLAKSPYIRESRRIRAQFTVLEQHVSTDYQVRQTGLPPDQVKPASFPDSVGIGHYRIDLHPTTGGDNYLDIDSLRFEIPLGALLPIRMLNLLPACKNIGTTHITNGCYRLHPVEWNIGEAAGELVAFCAARHLLPAQVRNKTDVLLTFQLQLRDRGIRTQWE